MHSFARAQLNIIPNCLPLISIATPKALHLIAPSHNYVSRTTLHRANREGEGEESAGSLEHPVRVSLHRAIQPSPDQKIQETRIPSPKPIPKTPSGVTATASSQAPKPLSNSLLPNGKRRSRIACVRSCSLSRTTRSLSSFGTSTRTVMME